jgi:hypothetical protein
MEKLRKKTQEIIRKAFELWDIKDWNPSDIDPVVNLLFAACANEAIFLENKIKDSVTKTKNSLIHTFLPPSYLSARPASAIATAIPLDPSMKLTRSHEFNYTTFITKNLTKEPVNLSFRPVIESKLFNLKPRFKYDGHTLTNLDDQTAYQPHKENRNCQSIWYGVEFNNYIDSFGGLSIFLTFKDSIEVGNHLINEFNFHENVALYYENSKVELTNGFQIPAFYDLASKFSKTPSQSTLAFLDVLKESLYYFEDGFCQVAESVTNNRKLIKKRYPEHFTSVFDAEILDVLNEDIIWFEFRFDTISKDDFQKISIYFNAFPLLNLRDAQATLSRDEPIQQIKIKESEHMITVSDHAVYDDYHNIIDDPKSSLAPFVIRDIDMEKLTGHELHELIDEMLDKFQTDYHAFQEDFNVSADDISKLRDAMKPIHSEKIKSKNARKSKKVFAILKSSNQKDIASVEVRCTLTNGEVGNNLKSGEKLSPISPFFIPDSTSLITKTIGGRDQLSSEQKAVAVRNLILSNNQIITYEDIKSFFISEIGDTLKKISITDSVMKGEYGLKKCTLVKIVLDKSVVQDKNLQIIRQNLENKIKRNSSLIVPVVVNLSLS